MQVVLGHRRIAVQPHERSRQAFLPQIARRAPVRGAAHFLYLLRHRYVQIGSGYRGRVSHPGSRFVDMAWNCAPAEDFVPEYSKQLIFPSTPLAVAVHTAVPNTPAAVPSGGSWQSGTYRRNPDETFEPNASLAYAEKGFWTPEKRPNEESTTCSG
jgi:hypothetical protein